MIRRRTSASSCSTGQDDRGFTLIELLVVMIIIGILAAVAIPVFLSQRAKARDAGTKSDVARVGKEAAAYFVDGTGVLTLDTSVTGTATLKVGAAVISSVILSNGTVAQTPATAAFTASPTSLNWCVGLTNTDGAQKSYKYSAASGLGTGGCP